MTIGKLKENSIHSVMLTESNSKVAHWVLEQLDIGVIYAKVLPDEKAEYVKKSKRKKIGRLR